MPDTQFLLLIQADTGQAESSVDTRVVSPDYLQHYGVQIYLRFDLYK